MVTCEWAVNSQQNVIQSLFQKLCGWVAAGGGSLPFRGTESSQLCPGGGHKRQRHLDVPPSAPSAGTCVRRDCVNKSGSGVWPWRPRFLRRELPVSTSLTRLLRVLPTPSSLPRAPAWAGHCRTLSAVGSGATPARAETGPSALSWPACLPASSVRGRGVSVQHRVTLRGVSEKSFDQR